MTDLRVIEPVNPSADVIDTLELVLEMARADELSSVAVAFVYRDGSTGQRWSEAPWVGPLIASIATAQHRLIGRMIE